MAQVVHHCSIAPFRSIERAPSPAALGAPMRDQKGSQLRLPVQAGSINRSKALPPFLVDYGPFRAVPEADPVPDIHAYFSSQADPRTGICSVLSDYAVARCFEAGGLF